MAVLPLPAKGDTAVTILAKSGKLSGIPIGKLRFHGLTNLEGLLRFVRDWLLRHKYDVFEKSFKSKMFTAGSRREIKWDCKKQVTEYISYQILLEWTIRDIIDVEVVKGGKKEKLQQCRIILDINSTLIADPNKRFGSSKFWKSVQEFYHRYIIKKDLLYIHADTMIYHHLKLYKSIQDYLGIEAKYTARGI